ncbi:MAG: transcriptional repressor [Myxococcota bacterium]
MAASEQQVEHVGSSVELTALFERLDAYMAQKGLRSTAQRRLIAETFFEGPKHVTIDEVLVAVRKREPRIGYATVYRTLKLFAECGIAAERNFGDGQTRYDILDEGEEEHDDHDHLICTECGCIVEFQDDEIRAAQERLAAKHGFEVTSRKHVIYGLCRACRSPTSRGSRRRSAQTETRPADRGVADLRP